MCNFSCMALGWALTCPFNIRSWCWYSPTHKIPLYVMVTYHDNVCITGTLRLSCIARSPEGSPELRKGGHVRMSYSVSLGSPESMEGKNVTYLLYMKVSSFSLPRSVCRRTARALPYTVVFTACKSMQYSLTYGTFTIMIIVNSPN